MLELEHILKPPSFLDSIAAPILGFGGCFIVILFFIAANKGRLKTKWAVAVAGVVYFLAIATGIGLTGTFSDRTGAFIAGFWAPMIYSLLVTALVIIFYKPPKEGISNIDHLINH